MSPLSSSELRAQGALGVPGVAAVSCAFDENLGS